MNYVKVESSQIAEVGYMEVPEGPDAPGVLGIRFKTKTGYSEYRYGKVSSRTHQALMAAPSIGSYFGQNIKSRPDLYPFTKIGAEPTDPTLPAPETAGSGTETPSAALAIIDTLTPDKLFAAGGVTDAQLLAGREWYLAEAKKYDISTEEKRTELKRFARPLQKLRTGIEARAKEYTGETKRKLAAIDTEKRRLVLIVGGIEDDVLRPLTEWEAAENERKSTLAAVVNGLAAKGQPHLYLNATAIDAAIGELESFDTSTMQEYKLSADSAIIASLKVLNAESVRWKKHDAEQAELAELRRKQAERDEQDRQAEQKRQDEERIEAAAERRAAEMVAEITAQPEPTLDELKAKHAKIAEDFQEPQTHEEHVDDEVVEALIGCALTRGEARSVLLALKMNLIPHVKLIYRG